MAAHVHLSEYVESRFICVTVLSRVYVESKFIYVTASFRERMLNQDSYAVSHPVGIYGT